MGGESGGGGADPMDGSGREGAQENKHNECFSYVV